MKVFFLKYKQDLLFLLLSAVVFYISIILGWWHWNVGFHAVPAYQEVAELADSDLTFKELSMYFTNLAQEKGAAYAFEVLKRISVPPNIDMHLLGHVVGDELYKQKRAEGIYICTNDFRNACSHSIVVGIFYEKGDAALSEIAEVCRKAPGGRGAYTMCFHGLGHGILAYADYEFSETARLCKKTGTPEYRNREYAECVGGAVMELIGGGFHDKKLWAEMRPRFLQQEYPLSLCSLDMIPDNEARELCYVYITPYLFEAVGADIGSPTGDDFKKAFPYCNTIPLNETVFRDACYRGFGKEFVGLVLGRDIRASSIENMDEDQLSRVYEWCLLADNREGSAACMLHAFDSLFWGGENDSSISVQFCTLMDDDYYKRSCIQHLVQTAHYYITDERRKEEFCNEMPEDYQQQCFERLR